MWEIIGIVLFYSLGALAQVLLFCGIPILLAIVFGATRDAFNNIHRSNK